MRITDALRFAAALLLACALGAAQAQPANSEALETILPTDCTP